MTTAPISMGHPGVTMAPGDHICAFYRGTDQRDQILLPFLREGLSAGDRCIAVLDDPDLDRVTKPLSLGLDVARTLRDGQFDLLASDEAYLVGGTFRLDRMIEFWDDWVAPAVSSGRFPLVRAVGEMTWALRDAPGVDDLIRYEARLNQFLPRYPQVILCLYDLERFTDGLLLMEVLRTHPKVLLSGQLLENPWYVEAADPGSVP